MHKYRRMETALEMVNNPHVQPQHSFDCCCFIGVLRNYFLLNPPWKGCGGAKCHPKKLEENRERAETTKYFTHAKTHKFYVEFFCWFLCVSFLSSCVHRAECHEAEIPLFFVHRDRHHSPCCVTINHSSSNRLIICHVIIN